MKIEKKHCANDGCEETFFDFTKNGSRRYCSPRCKREEEFRKRRIRKDKKG